MAGSNKEFAAPPQTRGLSIVVPLYNEAAALARLHARLLDMARVLGDKRSLPCEVVYVDDGSRDDTRAIARGLPASAAGERFNAARANKNTL